ncbi:hypothetical protein [Arcanobacterium phocae]|nr:hypothetical protein [Arcanobacterium phocae]
MNIQAEDVIGKLSERIAVLSRDLAVAEAMVEALQGENTRLLEQATAPEE